MACFLEEGGRLADTAPIRPNFLRILATKERIGTQSTSEIHSLMTTAPVPGRSHQYKLQFKCGRTAPGTL